MAKEARQTTNEKHMTLIKEREKLSAYCDAYLQSSTKLEDKKFLSKEAYEELLQIADALGVDYVGEGVEHTFEYVRKDDEGRLYSPQLASAKGKLVAVWGGKTLEVTSFENISFEVSDGGRLSADVMYGVNDDIFSFNVKTKEDVNLPKASVINKRFSADPASILSFLREERNIEGLYKAEFTETTVNGVESLVTGKGSFPVLNTEGGYFWSPFEQNFSAADFPAILRYDAKKSEATLETATGDVFKAAVGSLTKKFSDLEDGKTYQVTDWKVQESKFGEQVILTIDDKNYRANSKIAQTVQALSPELSLEMPGLLEVLSRRVKKGSDGTEKVMVNARFIPPVTGEENDLLALLQDLRQREQNNASH